MYSDNISICMHDPVFNTVKFIDGQVGIKEFCTFHIFRDNKVNRVKKIIRKLVKRDAINTFATVGCRKNMFMVSNECKDYLRHRVQNTRKFCMSLLQCSNVNQ